MSRPFPFAHAMSVSQQDAEKLFIVSAVERVMATGSRRLAPPWQPAEIIGSSFHHGWNSRLN